MIAGILVLVYLCSGSLAQMGQRGYFLSKAELWPNRDVGRISTLGVPNGMPPNMDHEWIINGVPNSVIQLRCSNIVLRSPCQWNNVTIIDGNMGQAICGSQRDIFIESRTATLTLIISSGPNGGSMIDCVATSSLRYGNIPSYLTDASREINSDEHGMKPGRKATTCPCGWTNKPKTKSRIVGGAETAINEYPLAVSLIEIVDRNSQGFGYNRFCGGSIISPRHVLTAAHCTIDFVKDKSKELAVIVGDHDHTRWDETDANEIVLIEQTIIHERYDPSTTQNDISILKTKTPIKFSDKVGPVCMPTGPLNLQGQYLKGVGWGLTAHPGDQSKVLKKVWIQVLPLTTCNQYYPGSINLKSRHQMCVFGKQRGLCMGDSGGPVIWLDPNTNRYTLVGLTSFGRSCSNFYPDVVTDVAAFLPWINSKIKATGSAATCSSV